MTATPRQVSPAPNRATGLGWTAGIGRIGAISGPIVGGALLTSGIAYPWGFYVFAFVGGLGAVAIAAVGGVRASVAESSGAARVSTAKDS